jgi:hypothetical protein
MPIEKAGGRRLDQVGVNGGAMFLDTSIQPGSILGIVIRRKLQDEIRLFKLKSIRLKRLTYDGWLRHLRKNTCLKGQQQSIIF